MKGVQIEIAEVKENSDDTKLRIGSEHLTTHLGESHRYDNNKKMKLPQIKFRKLELQTKNTTTQVNLRSLDIK